MKNKGFKRYCDKDDGELLTCLKCRGELFLEEVGNIGYRYICNCASSSLFAHRLVDIEKDLTLDEVFAADGVDKFDFSSGGATWVYLNPDANCGTGQLVESSISWELILEAVEVSKIPRTDSHGNVTDDPDELFWDHLYENAKTWLRDNDGSEEFLGEFDEFVNGKWDLVSDKLPFNEALKAELIARARNGG